MKTKFYAYHIVTTGEKNIVTTWKECQNATKGKHSAYKKFKTREEAEEFLDKNNSRSTSEIDSKGIYFDSGTGGGKGTQVRVTDSLGESLLHYISPTEGITLEGNITLGLSSTNNYGELYGCFFALKIALRNGLLKIYGDSSIVINYWSLGTFKRTLPNETVKLIKKVITLRKEFESLGGVITFISGDLNPADLGYHS